MTPPVKPAHRYPRRRERALATRRRVLASARDRFLERGYVGTTIEAIAAGADVSPETVYATFGNKRTLLSEVVDVAIAGDVDAAPIMDQDWVDSMRQAPDPHARLAIMARSGRAILERRAAIDDVVAAAAASDPEIAALRDRGKADRLAGQRALLRIAVGSSELRKGLDLGSAADIVYAIGSPETYRLLVVDRGWSAAQFEHWYADTLERLLFGRHGA